MRKRATAFILTLVFGLSVFPSICRADSVKEFLVACGYGTLAGALVGVGSVALSENPSEKSMNIARGASLGLYAGIGYGLYQLKQPASKTSSHEVKLWMEPLYRPHGAEGLQVRWISASF